MKILTAREARIVEALAEAFFPREGVLSVGAEQARVVEYVDDFMGRIPLRDRWLVRGMFVMFEVGIGAFGPDRALLMSRASPDARRAYLAAWENSNLYFRRVAFQALRATLTMAYCADPEVVRQMGVGDGTETLRRHKAEQEAAASALVAAAQATRAAQAQESAREAFVPPRVAGIARGR